MEKYIQLKKYKNDNYTINEKEFTEEELSNNFIVAYCITTCKYQGDQIDTHYNIFDIDKMNANELYVALSRTTNINIFIYIIMKLNNIMNFLIMIKKKILFINHYRR